jgi:hypothetical protein
VDQPETSDFSPCSAIQPGAHDALSKARQRHAVLRNFLLGGVTAGLAMFSYSRTTYAACVIVDTTVTCTGDLSTGAATTNPATLLNVNSLTTDIAPGIGDGLNFTSDDTITIVSDTGPFRIIASDIGAKGIYAYASGAGAVSVTHSGDIVSESGRGISAFSGSGPVTIDSSGHIQADLEGIYARSTGAGAVSVTHTGDITSISNQGVYASSDTGKVTTVTSGDIQSNDRGIFARSAGAGEVAVVHTGDITSDNNRGIYALSSDGAISTTSTGAIQAADAGIYAKAISAGAVSVAHTGNITSTNNRGIYAGSDSGAVTTVSSGNIQAVGAGISAATNGAAAVSITHTGDIASSLNRGIDARSNSGAVTTVSSGNIQAVDIGISADTDGAARVSVTHTGDISSSDNRGIDARSNGGDVTTHSSGTFQTENDGIYARSTGAGSVGVIHTGDVTSNVNRGIFAESTTGSVAITLADGVVEGPNGAIEASSGTGTELTLNADSVLIGAITLGGTGAAVLNTGPGLSIAHTFTGTMPTIGDVSGNVAVASGNQIAVADVSGLAFADNQLSDTLDNLSGVLARAAHHKAGDWWISGFGGAGITSAHDNSAETTHEHGGIAAGATTVLDNGIQLGVFGGAASANYTTEISNGLSGSSNSYFAGLNGRFIGNLFYLDFAVTAGVSSHENERIVANNTVATGLERASSGFDSFFIAPEMTLSLAPDDFRLIPSLRLRYEAMYTDGFTEKGLTSGSISADGATSHALNMRIQGAVPIDLDVPGTTLVVRAGADIRLASHSGHDIRLMGVETRNAGADDEISARGFAGLDFTHALAEHAFLTASGEIRAETTGLSASASLGFRGRF